MKNIESVPHELLIREGKSQADRILQEVMEALYAKLPKKKNDEPDFILKDGTKCWLKAFYEPEILEGRDALQYGFDVVLEDGKPLDHIEFSVKSTGWGRNLSSLSHRDYRIK